MNCDWQTCRLREIADVIDSRHKTPTYAEVGFPMVRVVDVKGGALSLIGTKKVQAEVYKDFSKGRDPKVGDLVITRVGSYGNVSYVSSNDKFCLGQNTALIVPNHADRYLYYVLTSPWLKRQIEQAVVGAVQKTISLESIKNLSIPMPSAHIRKKISTLLSSIDDKIVINAQINQTLEQMAQALFKSWFVDFDPVIDNALEAGNPIPEPLAERAARRQAMWAAESEKAPVRLPAETRQLFPDRFEEDDVLGWVPEGWASKPLSQQIILIGGGTPKRSEESFWGGDIPWFSVKDAPSESDIFVLDTEDKITQSGLKGSSTKLLPVSTTIITARGTVGKLAITGEEMAMNQSCYGVRPIKGLGNYYNFYNVKNAVVGLRKNVHGAVFDTITRQTFETVSSPFPNENVVAEFENRVTVLMRKIKVALEENITLTQLRDTLLPKLLSGELQLPEAEAAVQTALEVEPV